MNFSVLIHEKPAMMLSLISISLFITGFFWIFLNVGNLVTPLILHFNEYGGVDRVGGILDLWMILAQGFLFFILNILLGLTFFKRIRPVAYLFFGTNVLMALMTLTAIIVIVSLN